MSFTIDLPVSQHLQRGKFWLVRSALSPGIISIRVHGEQRVVEDKKTIAKSILFYVLTALAIILAVPFFFFAQQKLNENARAGYEQLTQIPGQATAALATPELATSSARAVALPPKDKNLPEGSWVSIPRIGVFTKLQPTIDPEEALETGVWQVPDFGKPGDNGADPIILAAHRFGWDWWWKGDYWKYHSFHDLPTTESGDLVEIIHNQRKWVYEIYGEHEGESITDYEGDLILYTCKHLKSPVRHFRYARLVE